MAVPLEEKYNLGSPMMTGPFGTVIRAQCIADGTPAAVAVLDADVQGEEGAEERFLRDARALEGVTHDALPRVLDVGTNAEGSAYMAMELLEGSTLGERLAEEPALSIKELVEIVNKVLGGLAVAHEAGVVHGDIHPGWMLLPNLGATPKLMGFGINQGPARVGLGGTRGAEGRLGSLAYMAPEQARRQDDIDARADLFSLGVVLFEGVAGQLPFRGVDEAALREAIATGRPFPLHRIRKEAAGALGSTVARALHGDPKRRFPDALAMQKALRSAMIVASRVGKLPVPVCERGIVHPEEGTPPPAGTESVPPPSTGKPLSPQRKIPTSRAGRGLPTAPSAAPKAAAAPRPASPAAPAALPAAEASDGVSDLEPVTETDEASGEDRIDASGVPSAAAAGPDKDRTGELSIEDLLPIDGEPPLPESPPSPGASRPFPPMGAVLPDIPAIPAEPSGPSDSLEAQLASPPLTRRPLFLAAGAAAVVVLVYLLWPSAEEPKPVGASAPTEVGEPSVAAAKGDEAARETAPEAPLPVTITLTGVPDGAEVTLDGVSVEGRAVEIPAGDQAHTIEVQAPGFETWSQEVTGQKPQELAVTLTSLDAGTAETAEEALAESEAKAEPAPKAKAKAKAARRADARPRAKPRRRTKRATKRRTGPKRRTRRQQPSRRPSLARDPGF